MSLFNPSRDQVRGFFFETWRKYRHALELSAMESLALQAILLHPEYHAVLDSPAQHMARAYFPEMGETNPFLHMSLHVSVVEQVSINQPPGIRDIYQRLLQKHVDAHAAQHALLECLAETLWQAQREGKAPDGERYLQQLQQLVQA